MLSYLRCVWANKVTLIGYLLFALMLSEFATIDAHSGLLVRTWVAVLFAISAMALALTSAGMDTYKAYRHAQVLLRRERIDGSVRRMYRTGPYCDRMGAKVALVEHRRKSRSPTRRLSP